MAKDERVNLISPKDLEPVRASVIDRIVGAAQLGRADRILSIVAAVTMVDEALERHKGSQPPEIRFGHEKALLIMKRKTGNVPRHRLGCGNGLRNKWTIRMLNGV